MHRLSIENCTAIGVHRSVHCLLFASYIGHMHTRNRAVLARLKGDTTEYKFIQIFILTKKLE